jgi:hypothetical protein
VLKQGIDLVDFSCRLPHLSPHEVQILYQETLSQLRGESASISEPTELLRLRQWAYDQLPFRLSKTQAKVQQPPPEDRLCDECRRQLSPPVSRSCIRLVRPIGNIVGQGVHRSGWPYAIRSLNRLCCRNGILFDDFVEQRFSYQPVALPSTEPWVGVFHHPPQVPDFVIRCHHLQAILERPDWQESKPLLRGAIALSEYVADFLRDELDIAVVAIRHPAEIPEKIWDPGAYFASQSRRLLQLGWHLRNTRAIFHVPSMKNLQRLRLLPPHPWVQAYDRNVARHWSDQGTRREFDGVTDLGFVPAERYDELLATSVVLTELFDASANNVVVDCIARGTPLIVNRHPAVEEYLTPQYPLYFEDIRDIPALMSDCQILAAHRFLLALDRSWLDGQSFSDRVSEAVAQFR